MTKVNKISHLAIWSQVGLMKAWSHEKLKSLIQKANLSMWQLNKNQWRDLRKKILGAQIQIEKSTFRSWVLTPPIGGNVLTPIRFFVMAGVRELLTISEGSGKATETFDLAWGQGGLHG